MSIQTALLGAALLLLVGCSGAHFPDVAARPPAAYRYHAALDGLEAAADPFLEEQRVLEYFGINLLAEGILPVHLVLHNGTGATLLFEPGKVAVYSAVDHAEVPIVSVAAAQSPLVKERKSYEDLGAFAFVTLNPLLGWAAGHSSQELDVVTRNLARKYMFEKSIFSGETHSGFIYFTDPDPQRLGRPEKLTLSVVKFGNNQAVTVAVPMR